MGDALKGRSNWRGAPLGKIYLIIKGALEACEKRRREGPSKLRTELGSTSSPTNLNPKSEKMNPQRDELPPRRVDGGSGSMGQCSETRQQDGRSRS